MENLEDLPDLELPDLFDFPTQNEKVPAEVSQDELTEVENFFKSRLSTDFIQPFGESNEF